MFVFILHLLAYTSRGEVRNVWHLAVGGTRKFDDLHRAAWVAGDQDTSRARVTLAIHYWINLGGALEGSGLSPE